MELFFRKYGEGSPLIILHGLYGMSDNWMTIGKKIAEKNFCVYIPDQRNHGESPHSAEFSYEILSEDLNDFIHQHSLVDPIIIGHSMGGKVAMKYAMSKQGSIKKLIVVDIGIKNYGPHEEEIVDASLSVEIEKTTSRNEIENLLLDKIKSKRVSQLMMKNVKHIEEGHFDWKLNLNSIKANFPLLFAGIKSDRQYEGSTLFVRGEMSDYIKEEDIPDIRKLFTNVKIETIPGASHWVHADKPEEFLKLVIEFIRN